MNEIKPIHSRESCDVCQGRGVIYDEDGNSKMCVCSVRKQLEVYLGERFTGANGTTYPLDKSLPYDDFNRDCIITNGTPFGLCSLIKSFLFLRFFKSNSSGVRDWEFITGNHAMELYLGEQKHLYLYQVQVLFLDLSRSYSNKAMGQFLNYLIEERSCNGLITWIYTGSLSKAEVKEIYGSDIYDKFISEKKINISSFCEKVSSCIN